MLRLAGPGRINSSTGTRHRVRKLFETERRGTLEVKNKRRMEMFFLDRIKREFSADADGTAPNQAFWRAAQAGPARRPDFWTKR